MSILSLADSVRKVRKRVLQVIHAQPGIEDKWLKREVEYLYGDLIHPTIEKDEKKEENFAMFYTGNDNDDGSITLSDLYDINSCK